MPQDKPECRKFNRKLEILAAISIPAGLICPFIISIHYYIFPLAPMYFVHYFSHYRIYPLIYILTAIWYTWVLLYIWSNLMTMFLMIAAYNSIIVEIISQQFKPNQAIYKTIHTLR